LLQKKEIFEKLQANIASELTAKKNKIEKFREIQSTIISLYNQIIESHQNLHTRMQNLTQQTEALSSKWRSKFGMVKQYAYQAANDGHIVALIHRNFLDQFQQIVLYTELEIGLE